MRPLPHVEMFYSGAWHEVTEDVYSGAQIRTSRGRRSWAANPDPSKLEVPFHQSKSAYATAADGGPLAGRYAPRNPRSDLYGLIGRNTPLRLRLGPSRIRMRLPGAFTSFASTPDTVSLRLTGDQRLEVQLRPETWRPRLGMGVGGRYSGSAGNRALSLWITDTGHLRVRTSPDGTTTITTTSTDPLDITAGETWAAVWIDVNNGAGGHTVGFETSPDGVTWSPLGAPVVNVGTTTIHPAPVSLEVGRVGHADIAGSATIPAFRGDIGALRYRSGILASSTLIASPDFAAAAEGDTELTDAQGRVWELLNLARITDASTRIAGEASAWPQTWDLSTRIKAATVTASGVLRRAQRHTSPLKSSLRRDLATRSNVVAYWPMEEPAGARRFASALPGDTSTLGPLDPSEVKMGASADLFVASAPLPTIGDTTVFGTVPSYAAGMPQRLLFLIGVPADGLGSERLAARFMTGGTVARFDLYVTAGGGIRTRVYDDEGTQLHTNLSADALNGRPHMISVWVEQDGADVFYQVARFEVGANSAFVVATDTLIGQTFTRFSAVYLGSTEDVENTVYGHCAILNGDVNSVWDVVDNSLVAWAGETAADRLTRLGDDEGFPVRITGDGGTVAMGPQRTRTIVELLREVPATDLGILTDADDTAGSLDYRPAAALTREPALSIPYRLLTAPALPTDDDQGTVNRVTTTSANGAEFTVEDTTSTMSTSPPPDGVGLYDQAAPINADTEADNEANAWWRLALGTIDASRWPSVPLVLDHPDVAPIAEQVLALTVGDILEITDLPEGIPPAPVLLMIDAIADTITRAQHRVTFTTSPAGPWGDTSTWALGTGAPDGVARWDTNGTYRAGGPIDTTQTGITLVTPEGPTWTTDPAHFPFDIIGGGERMTVTAIGADTGGGAQLFTVIRSVENVVKTHPTGTEFSLAEPFVWSL